MKILVVIPTYNERSNIAQIVTEIFKTDARVEILVVDDQSPDGTGEVVEAMRVNEKRLHLLSRKNKQGLGRAYLAGFSWGMAQGFDVLAEMDADFSHRPVDLPKLLRAMDTYDFVVGSRYIDGGKVANWSLLRKFISRGGSLYARLILGYPIRDWTGGFNVWRRKVLEAIDMQTIQSEGYSFQIELKYRALRKEFRYCEVPIVFEDRREGQSKMSLKIVIEAFYRVWMIKFA